MIPAGKEPFPLCYAHSPLSLLIYIDLPMARITVEEPDRPPQELLPEPEFMGELRAPQIGLGD